MAGALTFTLEPMLYGDFTINNLASRKFAIVNGYFTYDAASCSALTITVAMTGLTDIRGFIAAPKGNVFWQFDPSTETVQPIPSAYASISGTCYAVFNATASNDVASITSVPFLAWGFQS